MKTDRIELETEITSVIESIKHDRKRLLVLEKGLSKYNIRPTWFDDITLGKVSLSTLDYTHLYILTESLFEITDDKAISPGRFFNKTEIDKAKQYQEETDHNTLFYPVVIDNVLMLTQDDYVTAMTAKQIKQLVDSNLLQYNFDTQRNAKLVKKKDTIIQVPNINQQSVKQIKEKLKNNDYHADTLRLNVLSDGEDNIFYEPKKMQLIINSGEIDILDGFHRLQALLAALEEEEIDFVFEVSIKNYGMRQAQQYVAQINTVNKMDKTHLQALRADRYSDMIVKNLQRESALKGRISQTSRMKHGVGYLTNFSILSDAINDNFKPANKMEVREISDFLTEFFDYLLGIFEAEFVTRIDEIRGHSVINHHNMFVGYIALAKKFYDSQLPVKQLKNVIEQIDFSQDNSDLSNIIKSINKDNSAKVRRKIREYFDQIVIN